MPRRAVTAFAATFVEAFAADAADGANSPPPTVDLMPVPDFEGLNTKARAARAASSGAHEKTNMLSVKKYASTATVVMKVNVEF